MSKRVIFSPFILLILLLAGYELYTSMKGRELMTAAHLIEGLSLAMPIKAQVTEFYFMRGEFPNSNEELGVPSPAMIRGRSVKSIEVGIGGKIKVTYNNAIKKDGSVLLIPRLPSNSSLSRIEWLCTTDSIEQSLFENMSVPCLYAPPGLLSELMEAIASADEVKVQRLIKGGVDVDGILHGDTPLISAISQDRHAIAKQLIVAGANVNRPSLVYQGQMPLMRAIVMGKAKMVEVLLDNGADIDAVDDVGKTALMHAAEKGRTNIIELLISRRANPLLLDKRGRDAVRYAKTNRRRKGNDKLIEAAKNQFPMLSASPELGGSSNALMLAARQGDVEKIRQLLESEISIEAVDGYNATALHYAIESRQRAVVKVLLEAGAKVDSVDHDGKTPLMLAVANGDNAIIDMLLHANANADLVDRYGNSAFLLAIRFGDESVVSQLLGANVQVTMNLALQESFASPASNKSIRLIQALLLNSSLPIESGARNLAKLLIEAIKVEQVSVAKFLLRNGANPNIKIESIPLHLALEKGSLELVRLLVDSGANVDAVNSMGKTALMLAVGARKIQLVRLLLEAGAKTDAVDVNGLTALRMAKANYSEDIVTLLRKYKK